MLKVEALESWGLWSEKVPGNKSDTEELVDGMFKSSEG